MTQKGGSSVDLTEREIKVATLLSKGKSITDIAKSIGKSVSSTEKYINKMKSTAEAKNAVHLIAILKDSNII